jgi:predicted dinucleotide-utilizing enzyme
MGGRCALRVDSSFLLRARFSINHHQSRAVGDFGSLSITIENRPVQSNQKSSVLAALAPFSWGKMKQLSLSVSTVVLRRTTYRETPVTSSS